MYSDDTPYDHLYEPMLTRDPKRPPDDDDEDDDDGGNRDGGGEDDPNADDDGFRGGDFDWWEILRAQRQQQADRLRTDALAGKRCNSYQVRRTSRLMTRFFDRVLRAHGAGLRITQIVVLLAIRHASARDRMADIAKKLWMHPATLSRSVTRLVNRGLLELGDARWDGRVRIARLTAEGNALLDAAHEPWMLAQNILRIALRDEGGALRGTRLYAEAARLRLHAMGLRWEMWVPPNTEPSLL